MSTPTDSTSRSESTAQFRPPTPGSSVYAPPTRVEADLLATGLPESVVAIISDDDTSDNTASSEACPVCEAKRLGAHCVDCGHAFQDERLRLRPLLRRGISRVFDLDAGLLHTFLELFRSPGRVARDYASGIRRQYVNPFNYFVLAAAVQIIGLSIIHEPMSQWLATSLTETPQDSNIWYHIFGEDWAQEYVNLTMSFMAQMYTWMAFLFFAIPLAVALRFLMGKRRMNLAEGIVFSLYVSGQLLLITATAIGLVLATGSMWYQQVAVYPMMFTWTMYAIFSYFGRSLKTFITGGVAMILAFVCFFLANTIGMLVNMVVTVGSDRIVNAFQSLVAQS